MREPRIPHIISRIPNEVRFKDAPRLKAMISVEFWNILEGMLSPRERELMEEARQSAADLPPSILAKIDEIILAQAETALNWRIVLSDFVQMRLHDWESRAENGPELFAQLGKAMETSARILQRRMPAPIRSLRSSETVFDLERFRVRCRQMVGHPEDLGSDSLWTVGRCGFLV